MEYSLTYTSRSHYKDGFLASSRKVVRNTALTALFALTTASGVLASELEVGIGTHFGFGRNYIDDFEAWIKNESITSFRDEMFWSELESEANTFLIKGRSVKTLEATQRLSKIGVAPLLILNYGNRLYDGGSQPRSQSGRVAFSKYAAFAAKELNAPNVEVWNEWNIGGGTNPKISTGSAEDYVKLSQEVYKKIKSTSPKTKVIAGALGDDYPNWKWAKEAMAAGLLNFADGLSVHLYNYALPRERGGAEEFIRRLDALADITKEYNGGSFFPLYVTEIGWPNYLGLKSASEEDASRDSGVFLILARARSHIKGVWFYEYRDSGNNPFDKEHHFGLVSTPNVEKPASCTIKTFSKFLKNASYLKDFSDRKSNQYMLFKLPNEQLLLAAWRKPSSSSTENRAQASFSGQPNVVQQFSTGCPAHQSIDIRPSIEGSQRYFFEVTEEPKLFVFPKGTTMDAITVN